MFWANHAGTELLLLTTQWIGTKWIGLGGLQSPSGQGSGWLLPLFLVGDRDILLHSTRGKACASMSYWAAAGKTSSGLAPTAGTSCVASRRADASVLRAGGAGSSSDGGDGADDGDGAGLGDGAGDGGHDFFGDGDGDRDGVGVGVGVGEDTAGDGDGDGDSAVDEGGETLDAAAAVVRAGRACSIRVP